MTDTELYKLCQNYGAQALKARQKFLGLLPEVLRRKLYEKKGFSSIYVFAFKLAGVSEKQVDAILGLDRKFKNLPTLNNALTNGEISVSKLSRIASIATEKNEKELCERAKILPRATLEVFVRDVKKDREERENDVLPETENMWESLPGQKLILDEDVEKELTEMQEKGIDVNKFLREILQKRKEDIEQKKEQIGRELVRARRDGEVSKGNEREELIEKARKNEKMAGGKSRYISVQIRNILHQEHGTKCAVPHCDKTGTEIHHALPFSIGNSHDPKFLIPLCEAHHKMAHLINEKFTEKVSAKT